VKFASVSDDDLDTMYRALVATMKTAEELARLGELEDRAMPFRVLEPTMQWTQTAAEIKTAIGETASKCGSGCSPAWRAASKR
ncbi:MAG: hypothetical protein QF464_15795, partial [Myxococcota bacterium]|nr:hypothetical protein [Myxococcota bacterium]